MLPLPAALRAVQHAVLLPYDSEEHLSAAPSLQGCKGCLLTWRSEVEVVGQERGGHKHSLVVCRRSRGEGHKEVVGIGEHGPAGQRCKGLWA